MTETADSTDRVVITLSVMLASILVAVDMSIANVALPHMQGSMSATQDQISWVLTSYLVAAAICIPLAGFLAVRFGRKRVIVCSVIGFVFSSAMCGASQSLNQIILSRLLQGAFGASLIPLSQALMLDIYPKERHGSAMALWGMGTLIGPILAPMLGGWLTDYYSWRWVFFINLPFGLMAFFGLFVFMKETKRNHSKRFDLFGFCLLGLGVGVLQMMLDRGELLNWFASPEIIVEAILAGLCIYLFFAHIFTHPHPFIEFGLFKDRNFSICLFLIFIIGAILYSIPALLPLLLQNLIDYPVVNVGLFIAPVGLGMMIAMLIIGRIANRIDLRLPVMLGFLLTGLSLLQMSHFTLEVTSWEVISSCFLQGLGFGSCYLPVVTMAFSTLESRYLDEGATMRSFLQNIGGSIGISISITGLSRNLQANHAVLSEHINLFNLPLKMTTELGFYDPTSVQGLAFIDAEVTRQAAMLAFLQDFRLMMWLCLISLPLAFLLRAPEKNHSAGRGLNPLRAKSGLCS